MSDAIPSGGENFSLRDILLRGRKLNVKERTHFFADWMTAQGEHNLSLYRREVVSMADREVMVYDRTARRCQPMLMFGSNNYLGLAAHPYVLQRVKEAVDRFGAGTGGPPLLNAYTSLHRELEERLAALKGQEDAVVFQSGYGANIGILSSLVQKHDTVIHDAYCHASFMDGLRMADCTSLKFPHNDVAELERLLVGLKGTSGDTFVGVEGVYSMDGDVAPLDRIVSLAHENGAMLMVDDAHGTGVLGDHGSGTAELFGVSSKVDVGMGTLSKAFGVTGGFVATSFALAEYIRYFARSYMFSSSIPPAGVAAVLAGLDLIEKEPRLRLTLRDNVAYLVSGLRRRGFDVRPAAGIIVLITPPGMNIRAAAVHFHRAGIFLNSVEYPAVPAHLQRFRISMMASHTHEDIDRLLEVIDEVWALYGTEHQSADALPLTAQNARLTTR